VLRRARHGVGNKNGGACEGETSLAANIPTGRTTEKPIERFLPSQVCRPNGTTFPRQLPKLILTVAPKSRAREV